MRKYKQNTAESLNADNSIRFSEMTELSDSEVGKQKQLPHLPQCSHGKKKKKKEKRVKRPLKDQSALASFSVM